MNALLDNTRYLYFAFILSVVATIVASQWLMQESFNQEDDRATRINIAGRQRMLSQRIVKDILLYQQSADSLAKNTIAKRVRSTCREWDLMTLALRDGSKIPPLKPVPSRAVRKELDSLRKTQRIVIDAVDRLLRAQDSITEQRAMTALLQVEGTFLSHMEYTVGLMEQDAKRGFRSLIFKDYAISIITCLLLILEFIFIVFPVLRRIRSNQKTLVEQNRALHKKSKELEKEIAVNTNNRSKIMELSREVASKEQLFGELVENATDIIFELNRNGQFIYGNKALLKTIGMSLEEIKKLHYWDLVAEEDKEEVVQFYARQLREKQRRSYLEFRMITGDNHFIWVGQQVTIHFKEQRYYKVRAVTRDISEMVKVREELKESSRKYKLLSEYSKDVIALQDPEGAYTFMSPSVEELIGYAPDEIIGMTPFDFAHADDHALISNVFTEYKEDNRIWMRNLRFRLRHRNGHYIWVESSGRFITSAEGRLESIQTTTREISWQVEAEELLRSSQENLESIIENTPDAIWSVDEHKRLLINNSAFDKLIVAITGKEHTLGLPIPDDLLGKEVAEQWVRAYDAAFSGQRFAVEVAITIEGTKHIFEQFFNPIYGLDESVHGVAIFARDVTVRKQSESELLRAKEKAEEASLAKEQFLSTMSHEMRTPMNAIIGMTHLLMQEKPRPDQQENLELLRFNSESLLALINDILDFNKIESGTLLLENLGFDLKQLVNSVISSNEIAAIEKHLQLRVSIAEEVPKLIKGDPKRLTQIINNLVSNAIKFTHVGEVHLSVKTDSHSNSPLLLFMIEDSGIGIPEDKLDTIFDRFTQGDTAITRKYGGSGLGLSITRSLVEMMGGTVSVESTLGEGSVFQFSLPYEAASTKEVLSYGFDNKQYFDFSKAQMHVLLVEDNRANRYVASRFLHKWGIVLSYAHNGVEALEMIQSRHFDLVLMDLQMPQMDGYQATIEIRKLPEAYFQQIPILALTASALADVGIKIARAGMDDVITKPFNPFELNLKIKKYYKEELPGRVKTDIHYDELNTVANGDVTFRQQLIRLALQEIEEFKEGFTDLLHEPNETALRRAYHKVKPTLLMLNLTEPGQVVEQAKEYLTAPDSKALQPIINRMHSLLEEICSNLKKELTTASADT